MVSVTLCVQLSTMFTPVQFILSGGKPDRIHTAKEARLCGISHIP